MNMDYLSICLCLQLLSILSYNFQHLDLFPPWVNLFLTMYFILFYATPNGIYFLISSIVFSIYRGWGRVNLVVFTCSTTTISQLNLLMTMLIALLIKFLNQVYSYLLKLAYQGTF